MERTIEFGLPICFARVRLAEKLEVLAKVRLAGKLEVLARARLVGIQVGFRVVSLFITDILFQFISEFGLANSCARMSSFSNHKPSIISKFQLAMWWTILGKERTNFTNI